MTRSLALLCALLLLAGRLAGAGQFESATPAVVPDRGQVARKLESVGTLIEKSSAAKQIETSGSAQARARREQARVLRNEAAMALAGGDTASAALLLDRAAREMFDAVRLAAPDQVIQAKQRADFEARLQSVQVLLEAQRRISSEKQAADAVQMGLRIEGLLREAREQAAAGKLERARTTLDQAYLAAKASIGGMRDGDTLVRSLDFSSKEEEYRYELDRNDTHLMLIGLLLEERRRTGSTDRMVQAHQDKAAELRRRAESLASRQDFEAAVHLLEQSTTELVRAIRGAGVYIPG
jgi:hypothetical protein